MPICRKCQSKFPNRIIIDKVERNVQNRKYCLGCSPFGQHNTTQIHVAITPQKERYCPRCKTTHPIDKFYNRRGKLHSSVYCKECTKQQTVERQQKFKAECVKYKGGCCEECGYKKCIAALEFHHSDRTAKEFNVSHARLKKMNKETMAELDKCKLLCANCHREVHYLTSSIQLSYED